MKKPLFIMKDEKGIALITAIMLLVILTIIGLAAVDTMQMERDIASGETSYRMGFYMADAGISYAKTLQSEDVPDTPHTAVSVSGVPFTLEIVRTWTDSTGERRFIVESTSHDPDGQAGTVTIQAEIQFPTQTNGRSLDPGHQATY
jgi:hypothetical protein